jgi:hypothetical protein
MVFETSRGIYQTGDIMATNHRRPGREAVSDTDLRAALVREQERSALLQRRAELLEEACRRAYRAAAWGGARREPDDNTNPGNSK